MLILFCEKCGKRVGQAELERRGMGNAPPGSVVICEACGAAPAVQVAMTASGAALKTAVQSEGSTAVLVAHRSEIIKPPSDGKSETAAPPEAAGKTGRRVKTSGATLPSTPKAAERQPPKPVLLIVGGTVAAAVVLGLIVVLFAGGGNEEQTAKKATTAPAPVPAPAPAQPKNWPVPSVERTTPAKPADVRPPATEKPPAPQPVSNPPPAVPKPPAPAASGLGSITDVKELRDKVKQLGRSTPREELRRLTGMIPPAEPEKVVFAGKFEKNAHSEFRGDYSSKLEYVDQQGEAALKITEGDDRLAFYYQTGSEFANNLRIRLRIFNQGLKDMRFSIQTPFNVRFNIPFKPPAEGQWGEVTVDCTKTLVDGVKLSNIPLQHIEVHGFRRGDKASGAWFAVSKFEILSGGD